MQTAVTDAQFDASVGNVKSGFFRRCVAHFAVSVARPPPTAKTMSALRISGILVSASAFSKVASSPYWKLPRISIFPSIALRISGSAAALDFSPPTMTAVLP